MKSLSCGRGSWQQSASARFASFTRLPESVKLKRFAQAQTQSRGLFVGSGGGLVSRPTGLDASFRVTYPDPTRFCRREARLWSTRR